MSTAWDNFCLEHGITRRHTARNRPQQNGVAERANRTIMEAADIAADILTKAVLLEKVNICCNLMRLEDLPH